MKRVYNQEEFANILRISTRSVRRMKEDKLIIPSYTITGRPYYTDDDVNKYYGWHDARKDK